MTHQSPIPSQPEKEFALIQELLSDETFKEFDQECSKLDSFDLLSIIEETKIGENAWSKVLAYLLDSRKNHKLGQRFIRGLITESLQPGWFETLPKEDECYVVALTEWRLRPGVKTRRADILLVIYDYYGEVRGVIGVENKIDAGELSNQVSDYQKAISRRFEKANIKKLMLFLSPEGKESETAHKEKNYDCPYIPISYQQIQAVCDKISKMANVGEQPRFLAKILTSHLQKMLHHEEHPLQSQINQLYQKHRQAIRVLLSNLPNVNRLFDALVEKWKPGEYTCHTYNEKGFCEFKVFRTFETDKLHQEGVVWIFRIFHPYNAPDIGDIFHIAIDIWVQDKSLRHKWLKWDGRFLNDSVKEYNETWEWVNLWQGDKYCLQDLGEIDAEQMFQKLISRIENTKDTIDKKILEFRQYDKANTHI